MTGGQRRKVVVSGKATKSSPKVSTARKLNRKLNDGELGGSKKTGKIVDKEEVSDITDTGEDSDVSTSQGVDRSGLQTWRGAGKKGKRTKQVIYVCKGGDVLPAMNPSKQVRCLSSVRHVITGFIQPVRG